MAWTEFGTITSLILSCYNLFQHRKNVISEKRQLATSYLIETQMWIDKLEKEIFSFRLNNSSLDSTDFKQIVELEQEIKLLKSELTQTFDGLTGNSKISTGNLNKIISNSKLMSAKSKNIFDFSSKGLLKIAEHIDKRQKIISR